MNIINNAKEIADLIKKMGDIELYRKIVELEAEIIEISRQKNELEGKCKELTRQVEFKESLSFRAPLYYAEGDHIPFCPQCWEASRLAIHMQGPFSEDYTSDTIWSCLNCQKRVFISRT